MREVIDYQWERIGPVLELLGYTGPIKKTAKRGEPFAIDRQLDIRLAMTGLEQVTLYAKDAYGVTSKEEAVLHVWGSVGQDTKKGCELVAAALTKAGIAARATTYQKCYVVAFNAGEWWK